MPVEPPAPSPLASPVQSPLDSAPESAEPSGLPPVARVVELELDPQPAAAQVARRVVRCVCEHLDAQALDDVQLIVSELVTNAVRYGRPDIRIRVRLAPFAIEVAVTDHAADLPPAQPQPAADHEPSGRGLAIVRELADAWGVEPLAEQPGKTVWAAVSRTG